MDALTSRECWASQDLAKIRGLIGWAEGLSRTLLTRNIF